jgi:alpha-tubulin suppressor-like RCC1 family protein
MRLSAVQALRPKGTGSQPVSSASAIVAGKNHTCVLLSTGNVQCWGEGSNGQIGNGATNDQKLAQGVNTINDAADLVAGHNHTCARRSGGTQMCWGMNTSGQIGDNTNTDRSAPVTVQLATNSQAMTGVSAIGAGGAHSCALTSTVTAECWGSNTQGQLGDNTKVDKDQASPVSMTCP